MKDESDIELGESLKVCRERRDKKLAGNFEIIIAKNIHHLGSLLLQMRMRSKYESSFHLYNIIFKY